MALTIATGFVVDDAIVVMENTTRHIEAGMTRMRAALLGAREVGFTVVSMSLSLVAVFIPFMFAGGIVGRIFREFTVTLSVSILISLVISLTTTPMMCSLLLRARARPQTLAVWRRLSSAASRQLRRDYERTLDWALHHPRIMMLMLCATIGLNVYLYIVIPKGFFPQQDTGQLQGGIRGDAASSFQLMKAQAAGGGENHSGGSGGEHRHRLGGRRRLRPWRRRRQRQSSPSHSSRCRSAAHFRRPDHCPLAAEAGSRYGGSDVLASRAGHPRRRRASANSQYQYTLLGDDLTELRTWSQKLRTALQDLPEITDVDTDLQPGGLEADLIVDRDSASRLGLTEIQIDNALGDAFAQAQVSNILNPFSPQQYHVVMEVAPEFWQNPEVLKELYVSTSGGAASGTQPTQAGRGHDHPQIGERGIRAPPSHRTLRAIWRQTRWRTPAAATPPPARPSASPLKPWCRFRHSVISPPAPRR